MPVLDYDRILNENPSKKLRIAHENLTKNFTEESAKDYSALYIGTPLPFLLENSRYIFSEPLYGYDYYVEQVLGDQNVFECVTSYPEELEKVNTYLEEYGPNMDPENREMYESLATKLTEKVDGSEILRSFRSLRTHDTMDVNPVTTESAAMYLMSAPFYMAKEDSDKIAILERVDEFMEVCEKHSDDEQEWKKVFESIVAANQLTEDPLYNYFVETYTSPKYRNMLNILSNESISDQIDSIDAIYEKDDTFREYASSYSAVESIFEIMESADLYEEEYRADRMKVDSLKKYAYGYLSDIINKEYVTCEEVNAPIKGYGRLFSEDTTVEDAVKEISTLADEYSTMYEQDLGDASKTIRSEIGYIREEEPRKKPTPPTNRSTASKTTLKAMETEKKYYQAKSKASERGEDVKGAVDAMSAIPKDIKNGIDDTIKKFDEMDDERRKKFMTKPGFRKDIFRKLKLALTYGAAASANLLLVPVTMMVRHLSKKKDRRVKNELLRELKSEIDICSEKIQDAGNAGDNQSKYKLMRIKTKLEAEYARVKTNSKYI